MNDTYKMDLILIHPPYLIALACIYIASVLREKDTTAWFEELHVDMNVVSLLKAKLCERGESIQFLLLGSCIEFVGCCNF